MKKVNRLGLKGFQSVEAISGLGLGNPPVSRRNADEINVIKIEGPFDDNGKLVKYVSKVQNYDYYVTTNKPIQKDEIGKIKWAVSYDNEKAEKSFYLFSGGKLINNKVRVAININKNVDKFRIYSYTKDFPKDNVSVEAVFKQAICFFIGGAGDKYSFGGIAPSGIIRDDVYQHFDIKQGVVFKDIKKDADAKTYLSTSYKSHYIGYNDAYKDKVQKEVIDKIPNKEGTSIYIIGHSLGGWNGAHLSQILTTKGYTVDMLVTLDPAGTKVGVTLATNIYWATPKPKCSYWINIYSNSTTFEIDNIIADIGGQWKPNSNYVTINYKTEFQHRYAGKMFTEILGTYLLSASDFLYDNINTYLNRQ